MPFKDKLQITVGLACALLLLGIGLQSVVAAPGDGFNCDGCIDKKDIANNAVGSGEIVNGAIKPGDLHSKTKSRVLEVRDVSIAGDSSSAQQTLATLTTPVAGNWLVTAKVWFHNNSTTAALLIACQLSGDGRTDTTRTLVQEDATDRADYDAVSLLLALKNAPASTNVVLSCNSFGVSMTYSDAVIMAEQVTSVSLVTEA